MSPKGGSRSSSTPYSRRAQPGQGPKSSRQQFSACGACRMRRVRCDLKDLAVTFTGDHPPACTNCSERGIKCVDEFADIKSVKLLRRGRRLQEVEQVYGKAPPKGASSSSTSLSSTSDHPKRPSTIPQLDAKFFASPFFARFDLQHSLLDPGEFASRYFAHLKGGSTLSIEGQLLAKVLVVWAASFGVDEFGAEITPSSNTNIVTNWRLDPGPEGTEKRARRERTDAMTQELLRLVDLHGVLRKPTWDGVRVLLLLWPLTQDVQTSLQRITMYESTLSQIYALCSIESPSSVRSGQGPYANALVRARIFWYAHVNEGITNALRGGRLVLTEDDLNAFRHTLPPTSPSPPASLPSPVSPSCNGDTQSTSDPAHQDASLFALTTHYFSLTLNLSAVCRHIHSVLTGPKARRCPVDSLDENGLRDVWEGLERCWDEFEGVRRSGLSAGGVSIGPVDVDRFVSSWQIFILSVVNNIIREALKQRVVSTSSPTLSSKPFPSSSSSASSTPSPDSALLLHAHATSKCRALLPRVLSILRRQLSIPSNGFFAYDAGLVKDGCFFAGFMLAQGDFEGEGHTLELGMDVEDGVEVCLHALGAMEWVFSKSDERQQTVRMIWETRKMREAENRRSRHAYSHGDDYDVQRGSRDNRSPFHHGSRYLDDRSSYLSRPLHAGRPRPSGAETLPVPPTLTHRPHLAPLSLASANLRVHSAPSTACTDTGSWPTYTPPGTVSTNRSSPEDIYDSPPASALGYMSSMQHFRNDSEVFYHTVPDLDHYDFSGSSTSSSDVSLANPPMQSMTSFSEQHEGFLDPNVFGGSVIASPAEDGCPRYEQPCNGYYQ